MNWTIPSNNLLRLFILFLLTLSLCACGGDENHKKTKGLTKKQLEESLIEANKKAVKTEDQQINDFIKRYNWQMTETGTGLRYSIYQKGNGRKAVENAVAVINFEVSLLNGEVIYTSDELGTREFVIGRGGVETGLEEGILYMREGDRAKFIIPSHLAHGLSGDQNKITGKATLVYDVELIKLK
jgi:FKBP-type peptidyl-prolyl cis-trans isomerase